LIPVQGPAMTSSTSVSPSSRMNFVLRVLALGVLGARASPGWWSVTLPLFRMTWQEG